MVIKITENQLKHILESPDKVGGLTNTRWFNTYDALAFGYLDGISHILVGYNDVLWKDNNEEISSKYLRTIPTTPHMDIPVFYTYLYPNEEIYDNLVEREDFRYAGRLWFEGNVISFWDYPQNKNELLKVLTDIENEVKKIYDINLNIINNNFKIELPNGEMVNIGDYVLPDKRSEEELKSQHTVSPLHKDMNDPRRIAYLNSKNSSKFKLPQGMTQAEYNSKIQTSESIEPKKVSQELLSYGENSLAEIIEPQDINLKSFEVKPTLNEMMWVDNKLNSKVRLRLLDIADDFIEYLNLSWVKPKDIIFTGSLANYNWSKYSDIDLHIIIDFTEVDENVEFVKEYVDSKKNLWNDGHKKLSIYGFPVELYVQDLSEEHNASGQYSIEKNKWLIEPSKENEEGLDVNTITMKSAKLINQIDDLEVKLSSLHNDNSYEMEQVAKQVKTLLDKIKNMRKSGLDKGGEFSAGNIIFKILRRTNRIEKLYNMKVKVYDFINTIYK